MKAKSTIAYKDKDNSFEKFLKWTDEKQILSDAIKPYIKRSYNSLEVGAGNGDLTKFYINKFSRATLLEPSKHLCSLLQKKFPAALVVNERIEDFDLKDKYDCIIASHVFQYIHQPEKELIKLFDLLQEGGTFLIVVLDITGAYYRYAEHFRNRVNNDAKEVEEYIYEKFVDFLNTKGIPFCTKEITSSIKTPSLSDFMSINDFHFDTDVTHLDEETIVEMKQYLKQYEKENYFEIELKHKLLIL